MGNPRAAFTLVELLVVVTIISILAAMLLPTLENAMEQARQIRCLGDRRQLGLGFLDFAGDHRDSVPHPIENWSSGNREMRFQIHFNTPVSSLNSGGSLVTPLGTLVAMRYLTMPGIFYCPSFMRTASSGSWGDGTGAAAWKALLNGDNDLTTSIGVGVAEYVNMRNDSWPNSIRWTNGYTVPGLRLLDMAENYKKNDSVGPILASCANYTSWPYIREAELDNQGVAAGAGLYWGWHPQRLHISHAMRGINAVFFDGSARWIDRREVRWANSLGSGYLMSTGDRLNQNFPFWSFIWLTSIGKSK